MKLVICGEGGLGHEVLDMVLQLQDMGIKKYDEILFLDDNPAKTGYMGYKAMVSEAIFDKYDTSDTKFVMAIGEPVYRRKLIDKIRERGYGFETLIHPNSYIGLNSVVGAGTVVQKFACISCDVVVGECCFLQPYSAVGHDCRIKENCTLSTNAALSGDVEIGENTYIAVGVSVMQGICIGHDSVVGMGSVVVRDIPENVIAMGNPARPMKYKDEQKVFS